MRLAIGAAAAAAAAAVVYYLRQRQSTIIPESEAYCEECDPDECPPAQRQREHQLQRQQSIGQGKLGQAITPQLARQKSSVDDGLLGWARYCAAPTKVFGSDGFTDAGVQRINLPHGAGELECVAAWLEDEEQSGMGALRPLHRLGTPERLSAWKERFGSLDLGDYDAVRESPSESLAHLASLGWSVLIIEPNRFFPCHQHPNVELIYCARGALYENRVLSSALINAPLPASGARVLVDSGFPRLFRVHQRRGGETFENPRFSVHQSYTLDEGCVLLVLWAGKHANLVDADNLLWDPARCQNPFCPMACPDKTFEALARNSAGKRATAEV